MGVALLSCAYLVSVLCSLISCGLSLRRRETSPTAAFALVVVTLALAWWAAVRGLVAVVAPTSVSSALLLSHYPAICLCVAGFVVVARVFADPAWRPRRRTFALLAVEPLLVVAAVATNGSDHLFLSGWRMHRGGGWAIETMGPLFWAHLVYSYGLLGINGLFLARAARGAGTLHRRQVRLTILGAGVPFVGNALTLTPWGRGWPDVTPILFVVTAIVIVYGLFRLDLMDLVPLARGLVLEELAEGVLVLDEHDRLIDLNPEGVIVLRLLRPDLDAIPLGASIAWVTGGADGAPLSDAELRVPTEDGERIFELRARVIRDGSGRPIGKVAVLREVTALVGANERLRHQLATIEHLRGELAELAVRDELTGLHNRRHLRSVLAAALASVRATGRELSLVIFDIDHFKSINDRFGHIAGDQVLQEMARVLSRGVREGDTLVRYGGEEFVLLLPDTSPDRAAERAEHFRRLATAVAVPGAVGSVTVTFSAGVSGTTSAGTDADALLRAADEALYAAKAAGRDRVVLAGAARC